MHLTMRITLRRLISFQKAKNINDSDYTVLNYLAHAYRLSGDTDNAISVFQEIIDKFPGTQKATKAEQQIEALGGL